MGNWGGGQEPPLHQMPDAASPNGSVHFRHCRDMGVEDSWRGDLMTKLWGDRPLMRGDLGGVTCLLCLSISSAVKCNSANQVDAYEKH